MSFKRWIDKIMDERMDFRASQTHSVFLVVCELGAQVDICITVFLLDMWSPHVETPVP